MLRSLESRHGVDVTTIFFYFRDGTSGFGFHFSAGVGKHNWVFLLGYIFFFFFFFFAKEMMDEAWLKQLQNLDLNFEDSQLMNNHILFLASGSLVRWFALSM
ncbi:hypothetical protein BO82DRAFT_27873 [Aspergillus uvarum CBS 121591]|uniref:Uncharacterized protein n=1 Tax=Aspergillus uvarum CBS 121591 TaxID=1448315 RepID=A0A319BSU6_9EURO|nr:hypothetical protein BO82DRAFT_27873 [Aspergillus uvarum CBS 121591]PYH75427.1 hypothetical protein BO82DRAFT_27873 [Aspergillus uvarum CBS 121591]